MMRWSVQQQLKRSAEVVAISIERIALPARVSTGWQMTPAQVGAALSENRARARPRWCRARGRRFAMESMQEMSFQKPPLPEDSQHQVFERKIRDRADIAELVSAAIVLNGFAVPLEFGTICSEQRRCDGDIPSHTIFRVDQHQIALQLRLSFVGACDVNREYVV